MFLKPAHITKGGKKHTYWKLVESYRTPRGPRHRTVAYLGELGASERGGWARLGRSVGNRPEPAYPLFAQSEAKEPVPTTVEVNVRGVRVQRSRSFGDVYLGLVLWRTLGVRRSVRPTASQGAGRGAVGDGGSDSDHLTIL